MPTVDREAIQVFLSYAHKDETWREALVEQLAMLRREGRIRTWHDRDITAGEDWDQRISDRLEAAEVILLMVSPSFLASDYIWDVEVARAMEREQEKSARVVPIILRPCDWQPAPFGRLQALPKEGKPITTWDNQDQAFLDVAKGLRRLVEQLEAQRPRRMRSVSRSVRPRPISYRTMRDQGAIRELARVFDHRAAARGVLESAGIPLDEVPPFGPTSRDYWEEVCRLVAKGINPGGFRALLDAALERFPYNEVFLGIGEGAG